MNKALGILVGLILLIVTGLAFGVSMSGWRDGHSDIGLWYAIIGTLLGAAALSALIGTWIHSKGNRA